MSWSEKADIRGRIARHFGRRGSCLVLFGLMWAAVGHGIVSVPVERFSPGEGFALEFADDPRWGFGWMICGALAVMVGVMRRRVGNRDEWGFNALLIPPMVWSLTYGWAWVTAMVTDQRYGNIDGWVGTLIFGMAVMSILVISGWLDPSDEKRRAC